ncbi:hypothetical protein FQN60_008541, partial [Etheostoma spectabile]
PNPCLESPSSKQPTHCQAEIPQSSSRSLPTLFQFAACPPAELNQMTSKYNPRAADRARIRSPLSSPLPFLPKWCSHWTGEDRLEGVLCWTTKRWPTPMKKAINDLLHKHRGQKDIIKL